MGAFDPEETVDMVWATDSETGLQYLWDRKTSKIVARKDKDGQIISANGKVTTAEE